MAEQVRFGRYTVIRVLRRGPSSIAYQGEDPSNGRPVVVTAVKVPRDLTPRESDDARRQIEESLRTVAGLSHPSLVPVVDVGRQGDVVFAVTEPVAGETVAERLASGHHVPPREVAALVAEIGGALDYAHGHGLVHGNVSPNTILVGSDGRYVLADLGTVWGAARPGGGGQVVGAPEFTAPERVSGGPLTGASDQFSLGVVAYRLLGGERPFTGESATTVLHQVMHLDPPNPAVLNVGVSSALGRVVMRALEKQANDRYATCRAFADAFQASLADGQVATESAAREGVSTGGPFRRERGARLERGEVGSQAVDPWSDAPLHGDPDTPSDDAPVMAHVALRTRSASRGVWPWVGVAGGLIVVALAAWGLWVSGLLGPAVVETTIAVDSEPPGQELAIWLDDRPVELRTPANVRIEGEAGTVARLDLVRDDAVVASLDLTLGPDLPTEWVPEVEVPIVPVRYEVRSDPTGAYVRLDGQLIARTTPVEVELFPGQTYEISVELDGYHSSTRMVDPADLEKDVGFIEFSLDRVIRPGRLLAAADVPVTVVATPTDGGSEYRSQGQEVSLELPPGPYAVRVTAPDVFFVGQTELTVGEGQVIELPDMPRVVDVLVFDVPGNASVRIDDFEPFPSGGPHSVSTGRHRVVFEWPSGERVVRDVEIDRDGQQISARHP